MATAAPKHDRSKTAIIVGASGGLGLGLAREFARRGWHVTAAARNASIAPELADVVAASDGRFEVEKVDIDLAESVDGLATRLAGRRFDLVYSDLLDLLRVDFVNPVRTTLSETCRFEGGRWRVLQALRKQKPWH